MFDGLKISASALTAESFRLGIIANNLANADTTVTPQGGPYQAESVVFRPLPPPAAGPDRGIGQGVIVSQIVTDITPPKVVYDPSNPNANANGDVLYPNVNLALQMVDLIDASRAYQANVTAFQAAKAVALKALSIGA